MPMQTFVEDLIARNDPYAGLCRWVGCEQVATQVVGKWDGGTQNESEASVRYMCQPHALSTSQMVGEIAE